MSNLPNFIIVGPGKCGTQTLASQMREHPEIFMPIGEPHFFNKDKRYGLGVDFYQRLFIPSNAGDIKIYGEKTPSYSTSTAAAQRIAKLLPDVKIIWTIRDPIKRAYSSYWHAVSTGAEKRNIRNILKDDLECSYTSGGLYVDHIKRFLKYFKKSQMRFILFENFIKNQVETVQKLYEFVGVDEKYVPRQTKKGYLSFDRSNKINWFLYRRLKVKKGITRLPKNFHLQWFLRSMLDNLLQVIASERENVASLKIRALYHHLTMILKQNTAGYPKMPADVREILRRYYKPFNQELKDLLDLDISDYWIC